MYVCLLLFFRSAATGVGGISSDSFGEGDFGGGGSDSGPGAPSLSALEKEVAADVAGLSDVFSDAKAYTSDSLPRPASVREEEDQEEEERDGDGDAGEWRGFVETGDWLLLGLGCFNIGGFDSI